MPIAVRTDTWLASQLEW